MRRQKFLYSIFKRILDRSNFFLVFKTVTDNNDGTQTLGGICDFHHIQPGDKVTIAAVVYVVQDYDEAAGTLTVIGATPITATQFELNHPFFCHGTPMETQAENSKVESVIAKTPMIYLMEPFRTVTDNDIESSIDRVITCKVCFLTEADLAAWLIDDVYHKALTPMRNLMEDFIQQLIGSNLFYTVEMVTEPTYHTKFVIRVVEEGTKQLLFAESFAGVSVEMTLELYKDDVCECPTGLYLQNDNDIFIEVD